MGASGWDYWVAYQSDISAALQQLREQVFAQGGYYRPAVFYQALLEGGFVPDNMKEEFASHLAERYNQPPPQTIKELLEQNREEGTHSIIDIERISTTPASGAAAPLTPDELRRLFGTTQPTRDQVVAKDLLSNYQSQRWDGHYVITYAGDQPSEIYFWGYSGHYQLTNEATGHFTKSSERGYNGLINCRVM